MRTVTLEDKPYQPNFIHALFNWLDRLPMPPWLFILLLFPFVGIVQHLVAYGKGLLAWGEVNFDLATAGYWLISGPLLGLYMLKGSVQAWDDFRPLLKVSEQEYATLYYKYFTIPNLKGTVFFLIGCIGGAFNGFADKAVAPALDYAFAELRIGIWILGSAIGFTFFYQIFRQLRIIKKLYTIAENVDIFNQRPLYGFPKYTATLGIAIFVVLYLAPLVLDPTAFASQVSYVATVSFGPLILLMFYLPLTGMHDRLVHEKQALIKEANDRIQMIVGEIQKAAFEDKDFADIGGWISVRSVLLDERKKIENLSTWPWRPGTFRGLLSALILPVVLSILRDAITGILSF
jgi:hypothetical protein